MQILNKRPIDITEGFRFLEGQIRASGLMGATAGGPYNYQVDDDTCCGVAEPTAPRRRPQGQARSAGTSTEKVVPRPTSLLTRMAPFQARTMP